ncbi:MAG: peptidoglycan-binding domain-containing protein [bacterium]|nr:peptidoglycan-binding domain-containing protein [bacterium]
MKKTAISMLVGFALMLPIVASALTVDEIRAQIAQLLVQLQALQQQITQVAAQDSVNIASTTNNASCFRASHNLFRGQRGTDIEELQRFLLNTGDYTYGEITGFFGSATELAVQRFQCRNNIVCSGTPDDNGYGFVGARTRAAMSARCTSQSPTQSLPTPPSTISSQTTTQATRAPPSPPATIVHQCPEIPKPTCGGSLSSLGNDANRCHRGWLCEVRTVVQNNAPRLELSGPGSLWLGETGTWTVKVTDLDGDNVSVNMFFGNEAAIETINEIAAPTSAKSFTRTRSFSTTGAYPVRVEASDTVGNSARITSIVQVRGRSCSQNGATLEHGASKTFYSQTTASSGSICASISQSRTCTNGVLSGDGSYQYTTCNEAPAVPSSGGGGTVGASGTISSCPTVSGGSCQAANGTYSSGTTLDGQILSGGPYTLSVVVPAYTCTDGAWVCTRWCGTLQPQGTRHVYRSPGSCAAGAICSPYYGSLQACTNSAASDSSGGSCPAGYGWCPAGPAGYGCALLQNGVCPIIR